MQAATLHTSALVIRTATQADGPRLAELAVRFLASTRYGALATSYPQALDDLIALVLQLGVIFVAEVDGRIEAMLAIAALTHPLTGERYADEQVWWVEPEHRHSSIGPRLLNAAEAWAVEQDLAFVKMIAPAGSDVGAYYVRRGYVEIETVFQKQLHAQGTR